MSPVVAIRNAKRRLFWGLWLVTIAHFSSTLIAAQTKPRTISKPTSPPASERFIEAADLISPWRDSSCALAGAANLERYCMPIGGAEYKNASRVSIFNEDGSIWYTFDLNYSSSDYWWGNKKVQLNPFASIPQNYPLSLVFRMVAESPNWYKVEVNEATRATKYILRSEQGWSRTNWDGWLYAGKVLNLSDNFPALLDKPNGNPSSDSDTLKFKRVWFLKAEGDWAYIEARLNDDRSQKKYLGWIRWRDGRNILVGCYFNNFQAP